MTNRPSRATTLTELVPFLYKFAGRLTHNRERAEDLAHDTAIKVLENWDKFDGRDLQAWAGKIMFNHFVSQQRRAVRFDSQYDPEPHIMRAVARGSQEDALFVRQVFEQVAGLTDDQQGAIVSFALGNTYDEIAERTGIPVGTVRSRIARGRAQLVGREHVR